MVGKVAQAIVTGAKVIGGARKTSGQVKNIARNLNNNNLNKKATNKKVPSRNVGKNNLKRK